ncbi:MAG: hypothetical protein M3137_17405 [Actinomycetota bacterium]|nr:hypothetical protein [Actinomycetota bacterium]
MYGGSTGGLTGGGGLTVAAGGAGAGGGLAFTGFPVVGVILLALFLMVGGLILVRVAVVHRTHSVLGPLPSVPEPPASPDRD